MHIFQKLISLRTRTNLCKYKSVLQRLCSLSIDLFPREVIECGGFLMLEERVWRVCFCSAATIGNSGPRAALELMELPLGRFSPQMGTAGGDPPPRAGVTVPFHTQLLPPPPVLLPPCPAVPLSGLHLQSAAQRSLLTEGEVSVGVPDMGGPP